jgi:flavin-binding protein dodecin
MAVPGGPGRRYVVLMNQSSKDDTLQDVRPSPGPGKGAVSRQSSRDKRAKRSLPGSTVRREGRAISVQKALDLVGTGDSLQDAVTEALDRARLSLEGITGFEVQRIAGSVAESRTTYEVQVRVWFTLLERMHG